MSLSNGRDLTDARWVVLDPLIPEPLRPRTGEASLEGPTCCPEWDSMGAADGCSLGRPAGPVSILPNLPSPVSAMGSLRSGERDSGSSCPRPQRPRRLGYPGSLYRRELRS